MLVAWAVEAQNALTAQYSVFRRKHRQQLFVAQNYKVLATETHQQLHTVKHQLALLFRTAEDGIAADRKKKETATGEGILGNHNMLFSPFA
jgi:hypothetical protein